MSLRAKPSLHPPPGILAHRKLLRARQLVRIGFAELCNATSATEIDEAAYRKKLAVCVVMAGLVATRYFEFETSVLAELTFPAMLDVHARQNEISSGLIRLEKLVQSAPESCNLKAIARDIEFCVMQHFDWIDSFFCIART